MVLHSVAGGVPQRTAIWSSGTPAVILDRDGVINENRVDHVKTWAEFRFLPGAPEAIARLTRAGVPVFVVTNQAIINRGIVSDEAVQDLLQAMITEVARRGGRIDGVAYCPHRPDEACRCRKPGPGLLHELAHCFGLDLSRSVVVGDALTDLEAGRAAGCRTVLVLSGRGREQFERAVAADRRRITVVQDLVAAVDLVLSWFAVEPLTA